MRRLLTKLSSICYLIVHPRLWGKHVQIYGIPIIENEENLKIGYNVSINKRVYIQCVGGVEIGDCVTISHECVILTSGLETKDYANICMQKYRKHTVKSVKIGNGVWLGAGVKIMPGVEIASYCIIGSGSVVTKKLEKEGWLYAGIPAKPIKPLV